MIFIKPKKKEKRGIYIKFLATSSEIQICRIRITGKNKQNKIKTVSSSRSSLSFIEELEWNRRHVSYIPLQTADKLKLDVCCCWWWWGGGFGQQLKLPPGRHASRRLDDGKSVVSSHGVLDAGRRGEGGREEEEDFGNRQRIFFFKNSEEQKKWRKR